MEEKDLTALERIRDEIAFAEFHQKMDELMVDDSLIRIPINKIKSEVPDKSLDKILEITRDFFNFETKLTKEQLIKKYCR